MSAGKAAADEGAATVVESRIDRKLQRNLSRIDEELVKIGLVGGDVVDGVGCGFCCVDDDVAGERAVQIGRDAEVEVGLRAGDRGAEVVVGAAS